MGPPTQEFHPGELIDSAYERFVCLAGLGSEIRPCWTEESVFDYPRPTQHWIDVTILQIHRSLPERSFVYWDGFELLPI